MSINVFYNFLLSKQTKHLKIIYLHCVVYELQLSIYTIIKTKSLDVYFLIIGGKTMPKDINSNSAVAQAVATSIASSVSSLNQGTTITKDTQTTVTGNSNAQLMELFGLLVLGIIVYCVNNKLK